MELINNSIDKTTVMSLFQSGVRMYAETEHGTRYFEDAANVFLFLTDPDQFEASFQKVSKADFLAFKAAGGAVHCSAITKKGTPCQNYVQGAYPAHYGPSLYGYNRFSGYGQPTPAQTWITLHGAYCAFHEGGHDVAGR